MLGALRQRFSLNGLLLEVRVAEIEVEEIEVDGSQGSRDVDGRIAGICGHVARERCAAGLHIKEKNAANSVGAEQQRIELIEKACVESRHGAGFSAARQ